MTRTSGRRAFGRYRL